MVFCMLSLNSDVGTSPVAFLNLSSLAIEFFPASFGNSSAIFPGLTVSEQRSAAALPKTTKSISEFDPSLFAP